MYRYSILQADIPKVVTFLTGSAAKRKKVTVPKWAKEEPYFSDLPGRMKELLERNNPEEPHVLFALQLVGPWWYFCEQLISKMTDLDLDSLRIFLTYEGSSIC